ncbi:glycoside hydrolase family 3 N-terminal domain-containing protein [Arthrobacter sp. B2a2-09]|uniref:glycoside hydrolase family 3 N-terminal domain-containing protein n=1 Tax=Arthrobacter sp. B2a2-09 TaxID=2952822 RepID=UPI0022CD86F2|nr:glycoside hydrolase family 3 N-terminal domain-containing protein [Arthrobacter sp. B2a2-09]MCZ9880611.1 hypothetical protein [Arthrobacter sp. B2a2-09]
MADYPYSDAALEVEARVSDLLSRMTLDDKVGLIFHSSTGLANPESRDQYGRPAAGELIRDRHITAFLLQGSPKSGRELAEWHNRVQRIALEHPLGIPVTVSSDPRHAVTDNPLTGNESAAFSRWPEPIGIAAIGDEAVAEQFGDVTRREYMAGGIRLALHPQIDLTTEPRWARQVQRLTSSAARTEPMCSSAS